MIYKKYLTILVIVLATVLVGCGNTAEPTEEDTSSEVQETEEMDEEMESTEEADG